jgi:hypothetical protein
MNKSIVFFVILFMLRRNMFSQPETVKDIDGNIYKTVIIGNQIWMAENLRTTRLNDGKQILYVTDKLAWSQLNIPAYCWDNNIGSENNRQYGALYNWYTVETGRLCPNGWHVPSDKTGTNEPYVPVGYRDENGSFWSARNSSPIWTSTEYSLSQAYHTIVYFDNSQAQRDFSDKKYGITVRCVKNK